MPDEITTDVTAPALPRAIVRAVCAAEGIEIGGE